MSNFTQSGGRANFWQATSNLSCCSIDSFTKQLKGIKALAFLALFLFSISSVLGQSTERTSFYNLCINNVPSGPSEADVAAMFASQCPNDDAYVVKTSVLSGDNCDWQVIYTYDIKCGEFETQIKILMIGGDRTAPALNSGAQIPGNQENLNLCFSSIPEGPSEADIAALYSDNCTSVNVTKTGTPSGTDCEWSVTYTYTIVDDCGNAAPNVEVTYSGGDTKAPKLKKGSTIPQGDLNVNACFLNKSQGPTEAEIAALYQDNCSSEITVVKTSYSKGTDCKWLAIYDYTISDACGNFAPPIKITYQGRDMDAPTLNGVPDDITVNCIDEIPNPKKVSATDNCTQNLGKVSYSQDSSNLGLACAGGTVVRTWTISDPCGNTTTDSQTITVLPAPEAEFSTPQDYTISCDEVPNFQPVTLHYSNGIESGACAINGDAQGTYEPFAGSCGSFVVNYTFSDACERTINASLTVTVVDNTPPVVTPAQDMTVQCDGQGNVDALAAWLASNGGATGTDTCSDVTWTNDFTALSDDCGATGSATVEFTAHDACGNTEKTSATFTIVDTENPSIDEVAHDMTVECDGQGNADALEAWLASNGGAEASDNCSGVTWSNNFQALSDGCGATGSATVVFLATDACGNSSKTIATFTIEDTTAPDVVPAQDMIVDCDGQGNTEALAAWLASNGGATATDACSGVTWSNNFDGLSDDCGATGSATVEFTAVDACGNDTKTSATFTIRDINSPPITKSAQDMTVECDGQGNTEALAAWLASNGGASAYDLCSEISWSNDFTALSDDCGATGSATVLFTVVDECGNSSSTSATFTIEDTTAPSLEPASDMTVECDGQGNADALAAWLASNGGASASDSCSEVYWSNDFTGLSDDCGATGSATVTFTVEDACKNMTSTTATFTIVDTINPSIDVEAQNMTVECDGQGNADALAAWLASNGGASASDGCSGVTWTNDFTALSDDCGATGSATVEFTATDDCGNHSKTSATFTIEDTINPSIDVEAQDMTVECDGQGNADALAAWLASNGGASASDGCSGVTWTNDFETLSDDCGATGSATVEFTATDACGNHSKTSATFTIVDTTAPDITDATDLTVECDGQGNVEALNAWLANHGGATASDACSGVEWSNNFEALSDDCGATGSATVEFTVVDACGNDSKTSATFTIVDTTAPELTPAADMTVECDGQGNTEALAAWLASNGGATASDSCSEVYWSNDFTALSDDCGATGSATVTFTVEDACKNMTSTTATFTIVDTTAPSLEPASDMTVQCDGQGNVDALAAWLASNGGASASDSCSEVYWSNDFDGLSDDCGATGSATVTFTVEDACKNMTSTTATFTIIDTINPSIDLEAQNMTVECDGQGNADALAAWLASNGGAAASDGCSGVTWTNDFTALSDDCGATGSALVVFTAHDDCGNTSKTSATFTIEDTTAPDITPAADMTVECDGQGNAAELAAWVANHGGATASDTCGDITWSNSCGSSNSGGIAFNCIQNGGNYVISFGAPIGTDPNGYDIFPIGTTTYSGSPIDAEYTLTYNSSLSRWETNLIGGGLAWSSTGTTTSPSCNISDYVDAGPYCTILEVDCGQGQGSSVCELSDGCGATGSVTIDFTATDSCGNHSTTTATFTVVDTTAPDITDATDETVECDGQGNVEALNAWLANHGGATASDTCSGVTWSNDFEALSDDCGATGSATVEFTATDECGNHSKTSATFTIEDTTAPTITDATDATVECDGQGNVEALNAWLANHGGATAEDTCSGVEWSNDFTALSDDCGATGSATVEFTATDACGNHSKTSATFTIVDTTAPGFEVEAQDMTVECDGQGNADALAAWLASNGGALAYDDCSGVTWTNDFTALSDDCGATGSATVEFTATDDCGNHSKTSATFTIEDTTAPAFTYVPENLLLECDVAAPEGDATAGDTCGDTTVTYQDYTVNTPWAAIEQGNGTVDFSNLPNGFTATGSNSGTENGYFTVGLTTVKNVTISFDWNFSSNDYGGVFDPLVVIVNGSTYALYGDSNSTASGSYSQSFPAGTTFGVGIYTYDDLFGSASVVISNINITVTPFECPITNCFIRQFTATDACGNTSTANQVIAFQDTTAPVIEPQAQDMTVECDGQGNQAALEAWLASNGGASATDNCSEISWSNDFEALSDGCGATGSATVTFTVEDACGNPSTTTATFTIEDTIAPTITEEAADMTVECDGQGNVEALNAWLANHGGATAEDTCSGVEWSNDFTALSDDCGATGSATVEFTATDACGNHSKTSATFTIEDTTAPTITDATSQTVECDGQGNVEALNAWLANHGGATAEDTCSGVTWTNDFTALSDDCGATGSATVEFTATDDCGNHSKTSATFTIVDTTAPDITDAADMTVECDGQGNVEALNAWLANHGGATAEDACSGVTWTNDFTALSDDCGATGSATVEFTATDDCGNYSKTSATFTIEDTTLPVLIGQLPMGESNVNACYANMPQSLSEAEMAALYSDGCSGIVVTKTSVPLGDDCSWSVLHRYVISDECGNELPPVKVYFWGGDKTAPALVDGAQVPQGQLDMEACYSAIPEAPSVDDIRALYADNCGGDVIVTSKNSVTGDNCSWDATYTYTIMDGCGNKADNLVIRYTGGDHTPPTQIGDIPNGANSLDLCLSAAPEGPSADDIKALFTDNCSDVVVTKSEMVWGDDCAWNKVYIYQVADECGNALPEVKVWYNGGDTSAPVQEACFDDEVITVYTNNGAECPAEAEVSLTVGQEVTNTTQWTVAGITTKSIFGCFSDNCTAADDLTYVVTDKSKTQDGCSAILTVSFNVVDHCGNATPFVATFVVVDDTAPVVTCPDDQDFGLNPALNNDGTPVGVAGKAAYTDNCQGAGETTTYTDELSSSTGSATEKQITFSCTTPNGVFSYVFERSNYWNPDGTYNGHPYYQAVNLPYFAELFYDGSAYYIFDDAQYANPLIAYGTYDDAPCDINSYTNNTQCEFEVSCTATGGSPDNYTLVRTFTADDGCGNVGTCSVTYTWTEGAQAVPSQNQGNALAQLPCSIINGSLNNTTNGGTTARVAQGDVKIDFTAYPVPFDKEVNIAYSFDFDTNVTIELYDTKGLLIHSVVNNRYVKGSKDKAYFDLSRTANQMFYVKLTTSQGSVTKKIVSSSPNRRN